MQSFLMISPYCLERAALLTSELGFYRRRFGADSTGQGRQDGPRKSEVGRIKERSDNAPAMDEW